jgi:hypothetical protein
MKLIDFRENLNHYSRNMLKQLSKMLTQMDEQLQQESLDQLNEK